MFTPTPARLPETSRRAEQVAADKLHADAEAELMAIATRCFAAWMMPDAKSGAIALHGIIRTLADHRDESYQQTFSMLYTAHRAAEGVAK